ncbi:response regulator [Desulfococcus sp.]|uniref:response regulator n=1 Tax=Desulfococcus sp. TaxID=2025834 RepID=UPI00359420BC
MPETPTVLIIDDEERFCRTLAKVLSIHSISAAAALTGEAAMVALAKEAYDVVILDIKMPGIGGIELMKWIKKRQFPVEVIILSGHASMDVALEAVKLGAYDYLMKPCDIDELLVKISLAFECRLEREKCR